MNDNFTYFFVILLKKRYTCISTIVVYCEWPPCGLRPVPAVCHTRLPAAERSVPLNLG